jgi:probable phosphoglycerate mutase
MTTTIIVLIRHGQTDWNLSGRWQGHTDIALNDTGRSQASDLARRLASWPIAAIYSSDLRRAHQTASILARELGLSLKLDAAWRERNGGDFQGMTFEELDRRHPEALQAMRQRGEAPPGGESNLDVAGRVVAAFDQIVARHPGQMVAVVSHGGAMRALIGYVVGLPLGQSPRVSVSGNTGISLIEVNQWGTRLTLLNDTTHLHSDTAGFPADLG